MRLLLRVLLLLATFAGVGFLTMHLLVQRAVAHGVPEVSVRMGGALGGLFAGGTAACLVGFLLLFGRSRSREDDPQ